MALKMGEHYTPSHGQAQGRQTYGPEPGNPGTPDMRRGGMVQEIPADMGVRAGFDLQHREEMDSAVKAPQKPIGAGAMLDRIDASLDGLSNLLGALETDLGPLCIPPNGDGTEADKQQEMLYPVTEFGEALNSIDCRIKAFTRRIHDIRSDLRL